jgi:hypothetical protein
MMLPGRNEDWLFPRELRKIYLITPLRAAFLATSLTFGRSVFFIVLRLFVLFAFLVFDVVRARLGEPPLEQAMNETNLAKIVMADVLGTSPDINGNFTLTSYWPLAGRVHQ